ncbi:MAG: lamin tail domain-containing protein [Myxococcota bacterium]
MIPSRPSRLLIPCALALLLAACGDDGGGDGGEADVQTDAPGDVGGGDLLPDAPGDVPVDPDGTPDAGPDEGPDVPDAEPDTTETPKPVPGQVVFVEIMRDPQAVADTEGEWVEVINLGEEAADLNGCLLESDNDAIHTIAADGGLVVEPGALLVLGPNADTATNGGASVDYAWEDITLGNDADAITLACGGTVVDAVEWDASWLAPQGAAIQLDPESYHPVDNDAAANWCGAFEAYGDGDYGTPGADNPACPEATPVDHCRLQGPAVLEGFVGEDVSFTGRVRAAGLTDATSATDVTPLLQAQVGYGPDSSNPQALDSEWTWLPAEPDETWDDAEEPGHDQYVRQFPSPEEGAWDVAYRFSADGGLSWTVCDLDAGEGADGSEDGYQSANAGDLTVVQDPCVPNPCDDPPANTCDGDVLDKYPFEGTCAVVEGAASCEYAPETQDCADLGTTCEAGSCVGVSSSPTPGSVVITEIMKNPAAVSDGDGEWFEVTYVGDGAVDLQGCSLESTNDPGHTIAAGGPLLVASGDFLVLGANADDAANGGAPVDYAYAGITLANGDDVLRLVCGQVIDEVAWDDGGTFPDPNGASLSLDPSAFDADSNDGGLAWCEATSAYGAGDLGTPGTLNDACPDPCEGVVCDAPPAPECDGDTLLTYAETGTCAVGECSYEVAESTDCTLGGQVCFGGACMDESDVPLPPEAGDVVINEIMQNPDDPGDIDAEWFEVRNTTGHQVVLDGCEIRSDNDSPWSADGVVLPADALVVFGINGDEATNGGVAVDYEYESLTLGNGSDNLWLECGDLVVDEVAWDGGATFPDTEGASMQLDPAFLDFELNDEGEAWCAAALPYGDGELGTPGGDNHACDDPCVGAVCDTPPAPDCDGEVVQEYEAAGTCVEGECVYDVASTTDCTGTGDVCHQGACVEPGSVPPAPAAGEVIITEVMADPAAVSDADGEWFEIVNLGAGPVDLSACVLESDGDTAQPIESSGPYPLGADAYLVLGVNGDAGTNGGVTVDYVYAGLQLHNMEDTLALRCDGVVVDVILWDSTFPLTSGASIQVDPALSDHEFNDEAEAWCASLLPFGDGDTGTPGAENHACDDPCVGVTCDAPPAPDCAGDVVQVYATEGVCEDGACLYDVADTTDCTATDQACFDGQCVDAADVPVLPAEGEVVITEVMYDPVAVDDADGEWFEVVNTTGEALDLQGCAIGSTNDADHVIDAEPSLSIGPGATAVFAVNGDAETNGGAPVDYVYDGLFFGNDGDSVSLTCGGVLVDEVAWSEVDGWPNADGASLQLDPGAYDAAANDLVESWCMATEATGGGDPGSPGAENPPCPTACDDVVCDQQPSPACDGDTVLEFSSNGTCEDGECIYGVAGTTDCTQTGQVCQSGACVDPGQAAAVPGPGDVVITEIMKNPDPVLDSNGEWVELYNASDADVDVNGCVVSSPIEPDETIDTGGPLILAPGDFVVLGVNDATGDNGGVDVAWVWSALTLGNNSDTFTIACDGTTVDSVTYDPVDFPDTKGEALSLDPAAFDADLNDDGANWCDATTPFGTGQLGTPGAENPSCQ